MRALKRLFTRFRNLAVGRRSRRSAPGRDGIAFRDADRREHPHRNGPGGSAPPGSPEIRNRGGGSGGIAC